MECYKKPCEGCFNRTIPRDYDPCYYCDGINNYEHAHIWTKEEIAAIRKKAEEFEEFFGQK
jgi:hypothetical protein